MAFVLELEATQSPPAQREGTLIQSRNMTVSRSSNHQHHNASTHFAGGDVSPSVTVADRRFRAQCTSVQLLDNAIKET